MYHSELAVIVSALSEERDNRERFGMDVSLLDAIIDRANALNALDPSTLAGLVDKAQNLVSEQREELVAQLDALNALV